MKLPIIIAFLFVTLSLSGQIGDEIFRIVEVKPTFPGCDSIENHLKREDCATPKLLRFLFNNFQYPAEAREKGTACNVVIKFVVEKDGSITNAEIARDIGDGCGEEALRLVQTMPKWNPGRMKGEPVRTHLMLPIRFELE